MLDIKFISIVSYLATIEFKAPEHQNIFNIERISWNGERCRKNEY